MNPVDAIALGLLMLAVILGIRSGALPQLGGLVGAGIGAVAAISVLPTILPSIVPWPAGLRVGAILAVLFALIGVGEMIGARIGRVASGRLGNGFLGALDRAAGGIVGAGQAVLIVWLLGGVVTTGIVPTLERDAQTSVALRGIDAVLPPPTELVLGLGTALDQSGLPDVFLGLERLPADPVTLPADALARAVGERALASVPRIEADACTYRSTGTGVVVKSGYVVTNAHVVAGSRSVRVVTGTGALKAIVVAFDPDLDIAVLRVVGLDAGPLFFATSEPERGATGATIGYPNGGGAVIEPAAVGARYPAEGLDIYGTSRVRREIIELRAVVEPGDSGGPLLLTDGTVGGLVFAESRTDPSVGYALAPMAVAAAFAPALGRTASVTTGACLH
ncbi:MAG: MarP family serine protease [Chloroflexi bacterium]|nr:MarP family serine protease [Chloroflexota bacterium]